MAFNLDELKVIASGGGPGAGANIKIAIYVTNDTAAVVEAADYFGGAVDDGYLGLNDLIFAFMDIDGTPAFKIYRVSSATAGAVAVNAANDGTNDISA